MSENKHNFVWQDLFPSSVINPALTLRLGTTDLKAVCLYL